MLDNDYGTSDSDNDYLGQAKVDISDMLKYQPSDDQKTIKLTGCTQIRTIAGDPCIANNLFTLCVHDPAS